MHLCFRRLGPLPRPSRPRIIKFISIGLPVISGMVEERNARGTFVFPSELFVLNENTYDTVFNGGVNPVVHLGDNTITLNPGLQFTIRRDTRSRTD